MRLTQRVRQLTRGELSQVHNKLDDVLAAIDAAQQARDDHFSAGVKTDLFGDKKRAAGNPEAAQWNVKELRYAWKPVHEALEAWLDHGREVYFPTIEGWSGGDDDQLGPLQTALHDRQALSQRFFELLPPLRAQANFIGPVKRPVAELVAAVEIVQRVDDVELVPSILTGQRETSQQATGRQADRYRTSDDVARSLREARPAEPEPESLPEERVKDRGWLGKLTGFLRKG
jgi:hypothetical protein